MRKSGKIENIFVLTGYAFYYKIKIENYKGKSGDEKVFER